MSLRVRLVAATVVVSMLALAVAGVATYTAFSSSQLRQIDDALERTHQPVEDLVEGRSNSRDVERSIEQAAPGSFVELQLSDGTTVFALPTRDLGHEPVVADIGNLSEMSWPAEQVFGGPDPSHFVTVDSTDRSDELRVRVSRLDDGSFLAIGQSLHEVPESQKRLLTIQVSVAAAALLVAAIIGWILVRVGLRPLRRVEQTALLIAEGGNLDRLVPGADQNNEVGRLATALNTMLGRIREAFSQRDETVSELRESEERMRRFVADVSHELRTPLAAVSAYTELFERGARDHPEDLERALHGIDVETSRMHELVEELLLLARLDEGRPLENTRVDLSEVAVQAMSTARAVAPEWPVSLKVNDVIVVNGDAGRLRQVIDNLLSNVRTHTPRGTSTAIDIRVIEGSAVVTVSDTGPGMTPDQASRVFERFFRTDASRSRGSGGAGLGLSIVQGLVVAHGGQVRVRTAPGQGVAIIVTLPIDSASGSGSDSASDSVADSTADSTTDSTADSAADSAANAAADSAKGSAAQVGQP